MIFLRLVAGWNFDRLTDIAPAGEVPAIREILALLRLHRLDRAVVSLQEKTGPVLLIDQGEALPAWSQTRVVLDESILIHPEKGRDGSDLLIGHADKSRPAAAGRAALAEIGRRHGRIG